MLRAATPMLHVPDVRASVAWYEGIGCQVLEHAAPLFTEYQRAGAELVQLLRTEPWGARTFIVRDPDGNLLLFAGAA